MKCDQAWVEDVIVVEQPLFGDAVGRFDKSRIYTNDRGLVAVGKCFAHLCDGHVRSSSIILSTSLVGGVMQALQEHGSDTAKWRAEDRRNLYAIYHEFGHCMDHVQRPKTTPDYTSRNEEGRFLPPTVPAICAFHFETLVPELMACAFSGIGYHESLFALDSEMNDQTVVRGLDALACMTRESELDMNRLFFEAAALFWFVLIQHAKFVGSMLGNSSLSPRTSGELWRIARLFPEVAHTLDRAESVFREAWSCYPELPEHFLPEVTSCFHAISNAFGYSLEVRSGNSGIWWNAIKQSLAGMRLQLLVSGR